MTSTNENDNPSLALNYGSATPNLWGIGSASGSMQQCYNGETLSETTALTGVVLSPSNTPVAGYPEVGYGVDESDNSWGTQSSVIQFPMTISTLLSSDFVVTLSYTTSAAYPSHDTGFDLWVETGTDSGNQPTAAGYEIYLSFQMSPTFICSPYNGALSETITVNGVSTPETFEWCDYTNSNGNPGSSPPELQFNLPLASQIYSGTVSINLSTFISGMEGAGFFVDSQNPSGSLTNYYMQGIEFGNEFFDDGSSPSCTTLGCTAVATGAASFTFSLSEFTLSDSAGTVAMIPGTGGDTSAIDPSFTAANSTPQLATLSTYVTCPADVTSCGGATPVGVGTYPSGTVVTFTANPRIWLLRL